MEIFKTPKRVSHTQREAPPQELVPNPRLAPPDSRDSSSCSAQAGETNSRVSLVDLPLVNQLDLARPEVRNFAYRAFLTFLTWTGQHSARLQEPLVNNNHNSNNRNNSLPQILCLVALAQILAQRRRLASARRVGGFKISRINGYSSSFHQAEHLVRIPRTRRACSVPQNLPLVLVRPERLVQAGLDPQPALPLRVHLASPAPRTPQELSETPICLVTNLGLEQVSAFP